MTVNELKQLNFRGMLNIKKVAEYLGISAVTLRNRFKDDNWKVAQVKKIEQITKI